jgi:YidC/Oxa1 family membrane protein insertase
MQHLNPRIQEINKKYSDPKRRQQEMMKAYREAGINPLGCLGPFALQFPVLIALYIAVRITLPESPEALERLSGHLYDWSYLQRAIPLETHFLGLDLRAPNLPLVLLVAATTFLQSKTTVTVTTDERARAQQQMLTIMMPVMLGFFALNLPSGVSLYWVISGVVSIVFNVAIYGVPALKLEPLFHGPRPAPVAALPAQGSPATTTPSREPRTTNGQSRNKRPNRRRRP